LGERLPESRRFVEEKCRTVPVGLTLRGQVAQLVQYGTFPLHWSPRADVYQGRWATGLTQSYAPPGRWQELKSRFQIRSRGSVLETLLTAQMRLVLQNLQHTEDTREARRRTRKHRRHEMQRSKHPREMVISYNTQGANLTFTEINWHCEAARCF